MAVLQVLKGLKPGQQFVVERETSVLGRHPDCDIVLDVGAVSRRHAQILRQGDSFYVEDLASRNGTFLNGSPVQQRQMLRDNDRIKICDLLFRFTSGVPGVGSSRSDSFMAGSSSVAALFVDDQSTSASSTVMSKLDVSSGRDGLRVTVNPEAKLKALLEIGENLGAAISLDEVLARILDSLFKIFLQADRGFVLLRETDTAPLVPRAVKFRRGDEDETIRISRTIVNRVMADKQAILSADAASDSRFETSQSIADLSIRSMLCAPLVDTTGKVRGVIQIDTMDQRSRFQQDDLDVLVSVACQAATAIENAQLHESAMRQQALERDLLLARRVQQGFLPSDPPHVDGYEFSDFYEPANQVGGDYFDYVRLSGGRLAIVLADVSGKGVSAALLTAKLSSEARFSLASEPSAAAAVYRLNQAFCASTWEDRFVTMLVGILDPERNEIELVNAGHMAPLLRNANGKVERIGETETGLPIGVAADQSYDSCRLTLKPGECLTVFTDGISEAMDTDNQLYSLQRLEQELAAPAAGAKQLVANVLDDVRRFVGNREQSDDMCLICFGRQA